MTLAYSLFGFIIGVSLLVAFLFWKVTGHTVERLKDGNVAIWFKRLTPIFVVWIVTTLLLALSPVFRTPWVLNINAALPLVLSIVTPVLANTLLLCSSKHRQFIEAIELDRIVLVHALRALIGSSFLGLYALGYLAPDFALHAGFGDIAIGLSAIPVALLLKQKARYALTIAVLWNILGILDLINALRLGVGDQIPFIISTQTPLFIGIVPLLAVPLYVIWHIYSLYMLRNKSTFVSYKSDSAKFS